MEGAFGASGRSDAVKSNRDAMVGGAYARPARNAFQPARSQGVGDELGRIRGRIGGFQTHDYVEEL
jgi:hypothetical protein